MPAPRKPPPPVPSHPRKRPKPPSRRAVAGVSRTCEQAFDEWMRRFFADRAGFARDFEAVEAFVAEGGLDGKATTYGRTCAAYLRTLMGGG